MAIARSLFCFLYILERNAAESRSNQKWLVSRHCLCTCPRTQRTLWARLDITQLTEPTSTQLHGRSLRYDACFLGGGLFLIIYFCLNGLIQSGSARLSCVCGRFLLLWSEIQQMLGQKQSLGHGQIAYSPLHPSVSLIFTLLACVFAFKTLVRGHPQLMPNVNQKRKKKIFHPTKVLSVLN